MALCRKRNIGKVLFGALFLLLFFVSCNEESPIFGFVADSPVHSVSGEGVSLFKIGVNEPFDLFSYLVATDSEGRDLLDQVELKSGFIDVTRPGEYFLVYEVADRYLNVTSLSVKVVVREIPLLTDQAPRIILFDRWGNESNDAISFVKDELYVEPGFRVEDDQDEIPVENLSIFYYKGIAIIEENRVDEVDTSLGGIFTALYVALDSSGNSAQVFRHIYITNKGNAPVLELKRFLGDEGSDFLFQSDDFSVLELECNVHLYREYGASASDAEDGTIPSRGIEVVGDPRNLSPGIYSVQYQVRDKDFNPAVIQRTVILKDTVKPVLNFSADSTRHVFLKQDGVFIRPVFRIDEQGDMNLEQGDVSFHYYRIETVDGGENRVPVQSIVSDTNIPGDCYEVVYSITDSTKNRSDDLLQKIFIVDGIAPAITFVSGWEDLTFIVGDSWENDKNTHFIADAKTLSSSNPADLNLLPFWDSKSATRPEGDPGYFGHYEIDFSEVDLSKSGSYRVIYRAYDNAGSGLSSEVFLRPNVNSSERVRMVHVMGSPVWKNSCRFSPATESNLVKLEWVPLVGASGFTVFVSATHDGVYQRVETGGASGSGSFVNFSGDATQGFVSIGDMGAFFKIAGTYMTVTGEERVGPLSVLPVKTLPKGTFVTNLTVSGGDGVASRFDDRIELGWDSIAVADGYVVYGMTEDIYRSALPQELYDYRLGEVVNGNSFSYMKGSSTREISEVNLASMRGSAPAGWVYFWVEPFVDLSLCGGDGQFIAKDLVFGGNIDRGHRDVDGDEFASIVLKLIYEASRVLPWGETPWSDYWNASLNGSDEALINAGFDQDPSSVPGSVTGMKVNTDELGQGDVLEKSLGGGRSIVELVRTKENLLDGLNDNDHVFTRWWYDNITFSPDFIVEKGWRRCYVDWADKKNKTYARLFLGGLYSGEFRIDWVSCDGDSTKIGGACITSGNMQVDRNTADGWQAETISFNASKHFNW